LPLRSKFIGKAVKGKKEKGRHARRGEEAMPSKYFAREE
jgi:hypothetical protein